MRLCLSGMVGGVLAVSWATAAPAQDLYFKCSTQVSNGAVTTVYSSGVFRAPTSMYAAREYADAFKQFLISQGIAAPYANCSTNDTIEKSFKWLDYSEEHALKMKGRFQIVGWAPPNGKVVARGDSSPAPDTESAETAPRTPSRKVEQAPGKSKADYEAEYQAKLAAHEAKVAEYQRKVKAREEEIARQQKEHAEAQDAARRAQEAHAAKMTMFERVLEEQRQRQREYEASEARHRKCVSGDQQACADIKSGKPALEATQVAERAGKEEPMTSDDEARTCVTDPVLGPSKVWKGALAATIVNGCKTAVDARICLLREGGWNCGVYWGLKPQQPWTWTSFKATGDLFWDARIAGTGRPLASPE